VEWPTSGEWPHFWLGGGGKFVGCVVDFSTNHLRSLAEKEGKVKGFVPHASVSSAKPEKRSYQPLFSRFPCGFLSFLGNLARAILADSPVLLFWEFDAILRPTGRTPRRKAPQGHAVHLDFALLAPHKRQVMVAAEKCRMLCRTTRDRDPAAPKTSSPLNSAITSYQRSGSKSVWPEGIQALKAAQNKTKIDR
jgi:hypothetical protein